MAILNKETQFWTTSYRTAQFLLWAGFNFTKIISEKGRDLFVFEKSDDLMEAFSFSQTMRIKLKANKANKQL